MYVNKKKVCVYCVLKWKTKGYQEDIHATTEMNTLHAKSSETNRVYKVTYATKLEVLVQHIILCKLIIHNNS